MHLGPVAGGGLMPVVQADEQPPAGIGAGEGAGVLVLHVHPVTVSQRYAVGVSVVYRRTGYRAVAAASMLDAAGREVVAIHDGYDRAATAGLQLAGQKTRSH